MHFLRRDERIKLATEKINQIRQDGFFEDDDDHVKIIAILLDAIDDPELTKASEFLLPNKDEDEEDDDEEKPKPRRRIMLKNSLKP